MTHFRHVPAIKAVMTPFPWSVQLHDSAAHALAMMREHAIRHLPVLDGHALAGIVTDRDLRTCPDDEQAHRTVAEFHVPAPFAVDTEEPLDNVLDAMGARHIGAALVLHKGHLAGIFTAHDACRWFAQYLREQFRPSPGTDAA
jgi:acetoin utilization protein AcuB